MILRNLSIIQKNNIKCVISDGGLFSKITRAVEDVELKVLDVNSIESIELVNNDNRVPVNLFDFIYVNHSVISDLTVNGLNVTYKDEIPQVVLDRIKIILSKLVIKNNITEELNKIQSELLIDKDVLGVHLRLGSDMNFWHGNIYGMKYLNDYVNAIDTEFNKGIYRKIYVASDNDVALSRLMDIYGDKLLYYKFLRSKKEEITIEEIGNYLSDEQMMVDTFIDMLLLSKTGQLIHRVSNFANMVKMYSYTLPNKTILI